ncbi:MAG: flagellar hook protein FlgE [Syntrophomonadaceae bacterium]|nr:flagellar hook protein FlgE [Syntrophomonadaceae bacterium]
MMRSMYSGVSGLRTHQLRMDVIGNNIANVNTPGYKKSRAVFKDAFYQAVRGGSAATDSRGGTNPMAIGLGVGLSSVDVIATPGSAQTTGKNTDLSIDGNGYFILANGDERFFTRAGAFDFDVLGNFCNTSNGFRVMGYMADPVTGQIDTTQAIAPIDISGFKQVAPNPTTVMRFGGNLTSTTAVAGTIVTSKDIYDSLGNVHTMYTRFTKTGDNTWQYDVSDDPAFSSTLLTGTLAFDENGSVDTAASTDGGVPVLSYTPDGGAADMSVDLDLTRLTQYNATSTGWVEYQDGYTKGDLRSLSIDQNGTIQGVFSNGETKNLARVALATFQNPAGLLAKGGNLFQVSNNSGDANIGAPGEQAMGAVLPGTLEMSNVDLSEEFTDMIVTQRGFQANSRIITTSDEMLQELVNLKR